MHFFVSAWRELRDIGKLFSSCHPLKTRSINALQISRSRSASIRVEQSQLCARPFQTTRLGSSAGVPIPSSNDEAHQAFRPHSLRGVMGAKKLGVWRSGNRYAPLTSPLPRLRLLKLKRSRATLTLRSTKNRAAPCISFQRALSLPWSIYLVQFKQRSGDSFVVRFFLESD